MTDVLLAGSVVIGCVAVYAEKEGVRAYRRLADVLAHYDLGALKACRRTEHGYVNDTWAVETTVGRYVIKRRHPDLSEPRLVLGQHALMRHLCAMRFPVPRLIATRRGASFLGLDQDLYMEQFLAAYSEGVDLSSAEIHALPHLIRTIWLCASLDPPLRPRLSAKEAPQAVPEVLALADWAVAHTSQIVELSLGFVFAKRRSAGLDHLVGPR